MDKLKIELKKGVLRIKSGEKTIFRITLVLIWFLIMAAILIISMLTGKFPPW